VLHAFLHGIQTVLLFGEYLPEFLYAVPVDDFIDFEFFTHEQQILLSFEPSLFFLYFVKIFHLFLLLLLLFNALELFFLFT
jgi:hypothetical protein